MTHKKNKLSPRQFRALNSLLQFPSISQAAKHSGVSRSSIFRWLRDDELFQSEYRLLRRLEFAQTTAILTRLSQMSVVALSEIIADKTLPVTGRVSAIRAALQYAQSGLSEESTAFDAAILTEELERQKRGGYE